MEPLRSILLIDGDPNFRRALAIALRLEAIVALEAEGPAEAKRLLDAHQVDGILLHLQHPAAYPGLIEDVRKRAPRSRLVVCSAHQEVLDAARPRFDAAVQELLRPFTAATLLKRLQRPRQ